MPPNFEIVKSVPQQKKRLRITGLSQPWLWYVTEKIKEKLVNANVLSMTTQCWSPSPMPLFALLSRCMFQKVGPTSVCWLHWLLEAILDKIYSTAAWVFPETEGDYTANCATYELTRVLCRWSLDNHFRLSSNRGLIGSIPFTASIESLPEISVCDNSIREHPRLQAQQHAFRSESDLLSMQGTDTICASTHCNSEAVHPSCFKKRLLGALAVRLSLSFLPPPRNLIVELYCILMSWNSSVQLIL